MSYDTGEQICPSNFQIPKTYACCSQREIIKKTYIWNILYIFLVS